MVSGFCSIIKEEEKLPGHALVFSSVLTLVKTLLVCTREGKQPQSCCELEPILSLRTTIAAVQRDWLITALGTRANWEIAAQCP